MIYKSIKGFEGFYEVSSLGQVRSLKGREPKVLRTWLSRRHRYVSLCTGSGIPKKYLVARLVAQAFLKEDLGSGDVVDHIDGAPEAPEADRVVNLRVTTLSGNCRAFKRRTESFTSRYRGVSWDKTNQKWRAKIKIDGKHICLGRYRNEEDAAAAWDASAKANGYTDEALNFTP